MVADCSVTSPQHPAVTVPTTNEKKSVNTFLFFPFSMLVSKMKTKMRNADDIYHTEWFSKARMFQRNIAMPW